MPGVLAPLRPVTRRGLGPEKKHRKNPEEKSPAQWKGFVWTVRSALSIFATGIRVGFGGALDQ